MALTRKVFSVGEGSMAVVIPSQFAKSIGLEKGDSVSYELVYGQGILIRKMGEEVEKEPAVQKQRRF